MAMIEGKFNGISVPWVMRLHLALRISHPRICARFDYHEDSRFLSLYQAHGEKIVGVPRRQNGNAGNRCTLPLPRPDMKERALLYNSSSRLDIVCTVTQWPSFPALDIRNVSMLSCLDHQTVFILA